MPLNEMKPSLITILFLSIFTLFSCNDDDKIISTITASDLITSVDENPSLQQIIGKIEATTNEGTLRYEIISQNVIGSMSVNSSTGAIYVENPIAFDYEVNPLIMGVARISNGNTSKEVQIKITVRDILETTVSTSDFTFTINENPINQLLIGKISASTNTGTISYSIESQSAANALRIDSTTGNLYVLNRNHFNYESNSQITAIVKASNQNIFALSNIKININDLNSCDEENANMENYFADFVNTGNYIMINTMDLRTHEYSFYVTEELDLCSIGYQSNTGKPCVIELVDENNSVIYSSIFTFSKVKQDYKSIPSINLHPNKIYTIKRRFETYDNTSDVIGKLFSNKNFQTAVVPFQTGRIVITGSKFYDNGNANISTEYIPYITLGYTVP